MKWLPPLKTLVQREIDYLKVHSVCQFVDTIYTPQTNKQDSILKEISTNKDDSKELQTVKNRLFVSLTDTTKQTEKQDISNDVLEKFNENRPEGYKKTAQWLGKKLKGMGIRTRTVHGHSEILLQKSEFDLLVNQFISPLPLEETLPNPTTISEQGISTVSTGRELVGSCETLPKPYQGKTLDSQQSLSLVGSGRELDRGIEEKNINNDFVPEIEDDNGIFAFF